MERKYRFIFALLLLGFFSAIVAYAQEDAQRDGVTVSAFQQNDTGDEKLSLHYENSNNYSVKARAEVKYRCAGSAHVWTEPAELPAFLTPASSFDSWVDTCSGEVEVEQVRIISVQRVQP